MTVVVRAHELTKDFAVRRDRRSRHVAVDCVSFELVEGTCLGIVGESGSGKTTIARMLVGLETPTAGTVEICGERRGDRRESAAVRRAWARRIQMVYQDAYTSLDRRQTGEECINEVLALHYRLDDAERSARVDQLAERVGLTRAQFALRPSQLSGGQRQRLAIARALAVEPQVLVLDESVSALDVSVQAQVLNCLNDIREQLRMSYVFVSHDLGVIRQIADDVLVMRHGAVVERGPAGAVLDQPQHDYTRLLRDSVPTADWRPPEHPPITWS